MAASIRTEAGLQQLDQLLASRSYIGSDLSATAEDFKTYEAVSSVDHKNYANVFRWYRHLTTLKVKFPYKQWPAGKPLQLGDASAGAKAPATEAPAAKQEKPAEKKEQPKKEKEAKKEKPAAKAAPAPAAGGGGAKDEADEAAAKVQLLVGKVTKVWEHPESEKLWCEMVDCGEGTERQIGSGLRHFYKKEEFEGRMVIVVANLKEKKLAGLPSNGMVLCASNADHTEVKFVEVPAGAKPGDRVIFGDLGMEDPAPPNNCEKKKLFVKAQPHFTTKDGICMYKNHPFTLAAGQCTAPVADGWSLS